MPENSPCIVGVQSCGCITFAHARPDDLHRDDERALAKIIKEGGQVIRTTTGEARAMPHFLPAECPHDPKGWEPHVEPEWQPHLKRMKRGFAPGLWNVYVSIENWRQGFRAGQVQQIDREWWATEGWFTIGNAAHGGDHDRTPVETFGPFKTKKAAGEALIPLAVKRGAELVEKWAAQRAEKEAARAA